MLTTSFESFNIYIYLFAQKERRPNTLRDRKGKGGQTRTGSNSESGTAGSGGLGRDGQARTEAHDGGFGDGVADSEASRALSEAVTVVAVLSASRGIHQRVQALLS